MQSGHLSQAQKRTVMLTNFACLQHLACGWLLKLKTHNSIPDAFTPWKNSKFSCALESQNLIIYEKSVKSTIWDFVGNCTIREMKERLGTKLNYPLEE